MAKRSRPGAGQRDRAEQLGVAVARRRPASRRPRARRPSRSSTRRLELRAVGGVGADRAGERAHRRLLDRALEPAQVAVGLEGEAGELDAEGGGLGVHAVRAADAERVHVLARAARRARRGSSRAPAHEQPPGLRELERRAPCRARRRRSGRGGPSGPASPTDSATTSTNAATSWSVTFSRSLTASTVKVARSRIAAASSAGTTPRSASASITASSTSSQVSSLRCSDQTAPISGRV